MKKIFTLTALLFVAFFASGQTYYLTNVSTLAGSTSGYVDATVTAARFNNPWGVACSSIGDCYVVEHNNFRIRKITPAGVVTTFAGNGTQGNVNGVGTAASFGLLTAIAIDANDNIFVTDQAYSTVRKITPAGVVTTLATGIAGSTSGITVGPLGNIYVVQNSHHRVLKISPVGAVSAFVGSGVAGYVNGSGTTARFNYPQDITADASGNFYVTDAGNRRIRKITSTGVVSHFSGSGANGSADGSATTATFTGLRSIVYSNGSVFVSESGINNKRVRHLALDGTVTQMAGDGNVGTTNGQGFSARFSSPWGIASDGAGNLMLADYSNHRIRRLSSPTPLPVTLLNFDVRKQNKQAILSWTTPSEINNSHFIVQRSANGVDFETLDKVNSKSTDGNSSEELRYSFMDAAPFQARNYYRLQQVDIDGKKTVSDVIELIWDGGIDFSFYPNPIKDVLHLSWDTKGLQVNIRDVQGKVVLRSTNNILDVQDLIPGLYLLEVSKNGKRAIKKFIKE